MPAPSTSCQPTGVDLLLAIPEEERFHEVVGGELRQKAMPSPEHGDAQSWLAAFLKPPFARRPSEHRPGGWWIATEVEVELASSEIYRPDVVGWRRERAPERPRGTPVTLRPDWVCEVLSPSNANVDTIKKLRVYQRSAVPHYWILDPTEQSLTVLRWTPDGYLLALTAGPGERVRAEPFEAIDLPVGLLFGLEDSDR